MNSVSTGSITNFTKGGAIDFGAGFLGNLGGNTFGKAIEWATPGMKEEVGKVIGTLGGTVFKFGGSWSGNFVADKIGNAVNN